MAREKRREYFTSFFWQVTLAASRSGEDNRSERKLEEREREKERKKQGVTETRSLFFSPYVGVKRKRKKKKSTFFFFNVKKKEKY